MMNLHHGRRAISSISRSEMSGYRTMSTFSRDEYYTVAITGSSGLLGSALIDQLMRLTPKIKEKRIRIVRLVRSTQEQVKMSSSLLSSASWYSPSPETPSHTARPTDNIITSLPWNPINVNDDYVIHPTALEHIDAIVHLAGENVGTSLFLPGRLKESGLRAWTEEKKRRILDSRVGPTQSLAHAISECKSPTTFLVASGVGIYGHNFYQTYLNDYRDIIPSDQDDANHNENEALHAQGFLAHVSRKWEEASLPAKYYGGSSTSHDEKKENVVINLRLAPILSTRGGALAKLYPIFLLGGGGIVGSGTQYFSFISARDAARAIVHTLDSSSTFSSVLTGPVNLVAPVPCTNAEFTKALGKILHRPTILPMPSFLVKLLFGQMGEEMLLGGVLAKPAKLLETGFVFEHKTIDEALESALHETI